MENPKVHQQGVKIMTPLKEGKRCLYIQQEDIKQTVIVVISGKM